MLSGSVDDVIYIFLFCELNEIICILKFSLYIKQLQATTRGCEMTNVTTAGVFQASGLILFFVLRESNFKN